MTGLHRRLAAWSATPLIQYPLTAFAAACFSYGVVVPMQAPAQMYLALATLGVIVLLRRLNVSGVLRTVLLLCGAFLSLRYFAWRTIYTISAHDPFSFAASLTLYLAEGYGISIFLLGLFVNIRPLYRKPVPLLGAASHWPTVDVLIPSYNESEELLETTLIAATQVRYPADRLKVYLCDDGGTGQKRQSQDLQQAAQAWQRRRSLQKLCRRVGATYLTRERNEHAKAGNINEALKRTAGDLVLILDADHVPTADILTNTVGLFQRDERLFLVQTPHFFISPDPLEKNLRVFGEMPSENDMFYGVVQHGLDFWNASFFCGSAALLRRSHLERAGGIAGETITEDAETALGLHARGLNSAYINVPMIAGLQPETYSAFVIQRTRWAQGMTQIFLMKNPLRLGGLRIGQRLGYLSSSAFWFFAIARVVFLLAPAAYLIFGLRIYNATLKEFLLYPLPHVIGAVLVADFLFGRMRWAFVSELYELMQSFYNLTGIVRVIRNPQAPSFMVTPKGETLERESISRLSRPFHAVYVVMVLALSMGVWRWLGDPEDHDVIAITMAWAVFNMVLLNAALGALVERRQVRVTHRIPADAPAVLLDSAGRTLAGRLKDLSAGGASLELPESGVAAGERVTLSTHNAALGAASAIRAEVHNVRADRAGRMIVGLRFLAATLAEKREIISLVYGDSGRWIRFQNSRRFVHPVLPAFFLLFRLGIKYGVSHFLLMMRDFVQTLEDGLELLWRAAPVSRHARRSHNRVDASAGVHAPADRAEAHRHAVRGASRESAPMHGHG